MVKLELKKFNMNSIPDGAVILMLGKRHTGKSQLVRNFMKHNTDYPIGMVISPTEASNGFFQNFIPKMLIYDKYEPAILERFVSRQKKMTEQFKREEAKFGKTTLDPRAFLILDDCMYDKSWLTDENIRYLFFNGRHCKCAAMIITMQFPLGIPPMFRTNIDYIFILRENIINNRKRIFEQYAGMFPSFDAFSQVMDQCTENYECLVIDNRTQSNKLNDQVFWYKADVGGSDFKVCSQHLWSIQCQNDVSKGADADEDAEPEFSNELIVKSKKGPILNVRKARA